MALGLALASVLAGLTLRRNLDWHSKQPLWEAEARWTKDDPNSLT